MRRRTTTRFRDAVGVVVAGAVVSAAPAAWSRLVWPDERIFERAVDGWLWVFVFSIPPFVLLAVGRAALMGRAAALVALGVCAALVVFGQAAGLDPNDPSSTAAIALGIAPLYACLAVALALGGERLLRALLALRQRRSAG